MVQILFCKWCETLINLTAVLKFYDEELKVKHQVRRLWACHHAPALFNVFNGLLAVTASVLRLSDVTMLLHSSRSSDSLHLYVLQVFSSLQSSVQSHCSVRFSSADWHVRSLRPSPFPFDEILCCAALCFGSLSCILRIEKLGRFLSLRRAKDWQNLSIIYFISVLDDWTGLMGSQAQTCTSSSHAEE